MSEEKKLSMDEMAQAVGGEKRLGEKYKMYRCKDITCKGHETWVFFYLNNGCSYCGGPMEEKEFGEDDPRDY